MIRHDLTLIDRLAGIPQGGALDTTLRHRADMRRVIEDEYRRLLHPSDPGVASLIERRAVAAFAAALLDEDQTRDHFLGLLRATNPERIPLAALIEVEAEGSPTPGPYGSLPGHVPTVDDLDGAAYQVAPAMRSELGNRLAGALEHAHRRMFYPQDARPENQAVLRTAGWCPEGVALLDQIVDLVGIYARIVAGLRGYLALRQDFAIAAE
ncbi:MAG: CMD domain protein [Paracoccaceae bacterium]